jgi:hypothetical protein
MRGSTPASPDVSSAVSRTRQPRPLLGVLIALALLASADAVCALYVPRPMRLPAHFSSLYLDRFTAQFAGPADRPIVVLGDSVLWGYGVSARDGIVQRLRERFPSVRFANYAYEAEGPADVDFLLRYLLARGVRPRAIVLDLNTLAYNPFAKSYRNLGRALERKAPEFLQPFDAERIDLSDDVARPTFEQKLDAFMQDHWQLYGYRVDIHQFLFGDADLATALWNRWERRLRKERAPGERPEYFGLYDLTPLGADNVAFAYSAHSFALLKALHIPVVAFLPPVNHALVAQYIGSPAYDANLHRLQAVGKRYGITVINLDRLLQRASFLDNAHPNAAGNRQLAEALVPALRAAIAR